MAAPDDDYDLHAEKPSEGQIVHQVWESVPFKKLAWYVEDRDAAAVNRCVRQKSNEMV